MYAVILAGGSGTRLWPLSRSDRPKPFLPLLGERSLLRATFERILPALAGPGDVAVVVDRRHVELVRADLPEVPPRNVLAEPVGRNTAAAVALAAVALARAGDEVMAVLPADHLVVDEAGFRAVLARAAGVAGAADRPLVVLGIPPTGPETGYGYVVAAGPRPEAGAQAVRRFVEKPPADAAAALLAGPDAVAWNAGIFLWQRDAVVDAFAAFAPDILRVVRDGVAGGAAALGAAYATVRATSIDYAVLEPASVAGRVAMLPADVGWRDLGSWSAIRDALVARAVAAGVPAGTVGSGPRRDVGSEGTLVLAGRRLVVTLGLRDTIVVDTPDALLVCAADRSQDVRAVAEELARAAEEDA
ncbi:MAG TPA: sugar phosphate nucleotidyltransferase [Patescibacteria group bacterium]|nr:sugar phosphate nucleotidyltransferase [Patescibacteria group bacterium]